MEPEIYLSCLQQTFVLIPVKAFHNTTFCFLISTSVLPCCRLKKICPNSSRETCQWLNFPLNGLRAHSSVSPAVGLLPSASGPACLGMAFPPFLVKQLYCCDSVIISSFVRTGYTTRRWGWLLGRIVHVNRMPRNRLPRVMKNCFPTGRRSRGRPLKNFWIRETGTGQQVAKLHDRYMVMMMMMMMMSMMMTSVLFVLRAHFVFLVATTVVKRGEVSKSGIFPLCDFHQLPGNSLLLGPNVFSVLLLL